MHRKMLMKVNIALLVALILTPILQSIALAQEPPIVTEDIEEYSFVMPPSPSSAAAAEAKFSVRAQLVIDHLACSVEWQFLAWSTDGDEDENLTAILMAKIYKYLQLLNNPEFAFQGIRTDPNGAQPLCEGVQSEVKATSAEVASVLGYISSLGCIASGSSDVEEKIWTLRYQLTADCLRKQINQALQSINVNGRQVGTAGLPCPEGIIEGKVTSEGDYDAILKNLIRIVFLAHQVPVAVFDEATDKHIMQNLLTLDGGPVQESYALLDCGNTEEHTGSAKERADRENFLGDVLDLLPGDVGDALDEAARGINELIKYLLHLLKKYVPIYILGGIAGAAVGGPLGALIVTLSSGAVIVDVAASILPRIPETENHLIMMNSSAYLTNQIIREELEKEHYRVPPAFDNYQNGMHAWLLVHLQNYLQEDFIEYNARPYQRFTLNAILNLRDYAEDQDIRKAAEMVLDYQSAKFAVGSNQGRRSVPFRRRSEYACTTCKEGSKPADEDPNKPIAERCDPKVVINDLCNPPVDDIFYSTEGGDHQISRFLVLAGLTDLLPDHKAHNYAPYEMIYSAVSSYTVPSEILDIAIDKSTPYVQKIHHGHNGGIEVYASSPGFLISAGGIKTPHAYDGIGADLIDPTALGAALPTVVMPTVVGITRDNFIRFIGDEGEKGLCQDDGFGCGNWCVDAGFACGLNPVIPALYKHCTTTDGDWQFINSATCNFPGSLAIDDNKNAGPYFYAAIYSASCPATFDYCPGANKFGLIELVDAPEQAVDCMKSATNDPGAIASCRDQKSQKFMKFMQDVKAHNGTPLPIQWRAEQSIFGGQGYLSGTYVTHDGAKRYSLYYVKKENGASSSYIHAINGIIEADYTDWPLAKGDVINAKDGIIHIQNPNTHKEIILDFSDVNHPVTQPPTLNRGKPK